MTAPAWSDRVRTGAVFALAGPPAGLLMMLLAVLAFDRTGASGLAELRVLRDAPVLLALAYLVGGAPALVTAAFAAAVAGWTARPWRFAAATAAAGFLATVACTAWERPFHARAPQLGVAFAFGLVGGAAALVCAGLVLARSRSSGPRAEASDEAADLPSFRRKAEP